MTYPIYKHERRGSALEKAVPLGTRNRLDRQERDAAMVWATPHTPEKDG